MNQKEENIYERELRKNRKEYQLKKVLPNGVAKPIFIGTLENCKKKKSEVKLQYKMKNVKLLINY